MLTAAYTCCLHCKKNLQINTVIIWTYNQSVN